MNTWDNPESVEPRALLVDPVMQNCTIISYIHHSTTVVVRRILQSILSYDIIVSDHTRSTKYNDVYVLGKNIIKQSKKALKEHDSMEAPPIMACAAVHHAPLESAPVWTLLD